MYIIVEELCIIFQVEAALTTDQENQELLKLKVDLEEVIELTKDLVKAYQEELEQKKSESGGKIKEICTQYILLCQK